MRKVIIFFIISLSISLLIFAQENRTSAPSGAMHKVIAPLGVLDPDLEGVMLWHEYGAFALYSVTDTALGLMTPDMRSQVVLLDDTDRLLFGNSEVAPDGTLPQDIGAQEAPTGPALHLVQFVGPIKSEWLQAVEVTGARLIHYIANNGYLVWADAGSREQLNSAAIESVYLQLSRPYPPSLKIGPSLSKRIDAAESADVTVVIQMYRHEYRNETETLIHESAVEVFSEWTPVLAYQNAVVTLRLEDIDEIAARPDVYWIEERLDRELMDEVQGQLLAGNLNADQSGPSSPGYLPWLDSFGFSTSPADYPIVDFADDGIGNGSINSGDPTLHQFGNIANPTRLAYVANCTNAADGGGPDGHGHLNVSIAGGYDTDSGFPFQDPLGYQRGLGVNPYGRFSGTRIFDPNFDLSSCGSSYVGLIKSIQDNGARISNNSWGCSACAGAYDDTSQIYDAAVRDADQEESGNQEMIFIFPAGNSGPSSGTVATPGNAKNVITVGVSENQRPSDEDGAWTDGCSVGPTGADDAMDVINFSSRGPSPGSRVKPEVIAPGTHIQGTASTHPSYTGASVCDQYRPSGQTVFAAASGTSHSTAAVSGATSLAYWWMENIYGMTAPSPALMKAYLIAHPTYLTGVSANDTLPSNSQGYGMPNMAAMFDDAAKFLLDQSVTFDNSGETWTWEGAIADPTKPVRIVLTYTDAPGAVGTSPQVNDLNLSAEVGGTTYLGNVFSGQWSISGGSTDPFNNYEAIFLPPGSGGAIEITVTAFNIAGDGVPNSGDITDQDFAIVCYNCAQIPTFTLDAMPEELNVCAPNDAVYTVNVGSILGFSDPVTLSASGNPAGTTVNFSTNPVMPPGSSTLTIGNTGAAAFGWYGIDVTGISTSDSKIDTVTLDLFNAAPAAPILLAPADGTTDAPFKPTFSWTAVAQAASYLLEVATDPGFTNVVYSASETGTSHTAVVPFSAGTTYCWRVTAQNICGSGTSTTFSFTTTSATLVCNGWAVDFEDGIPSDWTVVSNAPGGIVWTTTADPACGIPNRTNGSGEAACADSDAAGSGAPPYDTELVTNPFDLSSVGSAVVDVKAYYNDITTDANDRFEMDVWNGTTWINELSWDEDHMPEDFSKNLSAYAGLPGVQLRFRYFGNGYDWYAQVDDIAITCVPIGPPMFELDPALVAWSQGPDQVEVVELVFSEGLPPCSMMVTNSGGSPLTWSIVEDDTACDSPTDIPWMSLTPIAGSTVPLDSTQIFMEIDSTGLAPGVYTANVCISTNDPNYPMFQAPVILTVEEPVGRLECNGAAIDFEDGIPNAWTVVDNTGGTGIVWTTTADHEACGIPNRTNGTGEAACADSDAAGFPAIPYDTELVSNLINMTAWGAAVLDVKAYYRDITTGANDRFEVDVWNGTTWINELSWDEDHEPEDFALNLSAYAGLPEVRVRFRYFGNGFDWYAQVDDIILTCAASGFPVIGVDPASLSFSQGPDVQNDRLLRITNSGGAALNWSIAEDDTACDSPADIPWLSVAPDMGTTIPLGSTDVTVTLDSTGLTPGVFTANLCISSNDSVTPLVQVPVLLTVEEPVVLQCNDESIGFEGGIPSGWSVIDNEGYGVVWTTIAASGESGNYTGGSGDAATVSSDRSGPAEFDTELRTATFDLSGWLPGDDIELFYLANYQNFSARDFLDLDISADGGATWITLQSWNEDHGSFRKTPGEAVSIDLSAYAGMSGLMLRWRYHDPNSGDYDWYAQLDDIGLGCTLQPVIDVDPDSLSNTQVPDHVSHLPLTIGNLGSSNLDWLMHEAVAPASVIQLAAIAAPDIREAPLQAGYSTEKYAASPNAILVSESFEDGVVPPPGWSQVVNNPNETWDIYSINPHSGVFSADIVYDPALIPQNEWLLSQPFEISEGTLSLWSFGSLYWCRDTYDNCDLKIWLVVGEPEGGDDVYVGIADDDWTSSYTWSQSVFSLTPLLPGGSVRLGFQYSGLDGAQIALDDIVLDGTSAGGCFAAEDIPWLSVSPDSGTTSPGGSTPLDVILDSSGMAPGVHEGLLCVSSNDPDTPLVPVPVTMTIEPFTIIVAKTPSPTSVYEPGGDVDFAVTVTNGSPVDATITSLVDTDFDLATHCPDAVGTVLAPSGSYECAFAEYVAGNAYQDHQNMVTANVTNGYGNTPSESDVADVSLLNAVPTITVVKEAPPYAYQGDPVIFTIAVANNSVATDPVTLTSIVDDVYGDVTSVHDDIIGTDCSAGVTILPGDTYSCSFTATVPDDLVGDQTDTVTVSGYDDEGTVTSHADSATVTVLPPTVATNSSMCIFDRDPESEEREFRLLFTPDVQNMPRFKLTASNPGQFFYNAFHIGDGPATFELTVPYPFVTQGAMPVHVYSGVAVYVNAKGESCFMPGTEEISYAEEITIGDHIDTNSDGEPDSVTVTITGVPVVDEFAYMNIHLDYGLKGGDERYGKASNPDGTEDAVDFETGEVLIEDRTTYDFSSEVNGDPLTGDSLVNDNEFKRTPGVAGFVWDNILDPIEGAVVRLIIPPGVKYKAPYLDAKTDEDGWYMIDYKHKGKPTDYPIQVWVGGSLVAEDSVTLKGNAFVEKNFIITTP